MKNESAPDEMNGHHAILQTPLPRDSVVAAVVNRFRKALITRELKPGDFLPPEQELAAQLGVGKSTVREAVKMLQALGVVEIRRGRGTVIREQLADGCIDPMIFQLIVQQGTTGQIIDLRAMLEPAYTIMAMQRATAEDVQRIGETIKQFETAIEEHRQTAEDDLAFHYAILESTHNPYVITIGRTVLQLFHASISRSMETIPRTALRDHKRIFRSFCKRDTSALHEAVLKSFLGWQQSLEPERS